MTVYTKLKNKLASDGAGEMAQHLGVLAADAGCQVQSPAPTLQLSASCNSSSRGLEAFFWPLPAPGTHTQDTQTCTQTLMHTIEK